MVKHRVMSRRCRAVVRTVVIAGSACVLFIALYFSAVLAGGLIQVNATDDVGRQNGTFIYLDNNGRHYDLWVPAEYCDFLHPATSEGWYGFGWGDRDFFLNTPYASDINLCILLKALFIPTRSVLAVQYSGDLPTLRSSVTPIPVSDQSASIIAGSVSGWFLRDDHGEMQRIPDEQVHPSYKGYRFYESRGRYSLFFTSNNWVGRALKTAGLPSGLWTPLTFGVFHISHD